MFLGGFLFEYCLFFLLKFSVFSVRKLVQSRNNGFETFECRKKWVVEMVSTQVASTRN